MWKRLALIAASAAGVAYLRKKAKDQQAEQDLWAQATDPIPPATPGEPKPQA
ncbi:DLW-39 family protein [Intrasporangium sp.]|uniref:DLW-39 family protein n=1 Tax=Intrasporangium sp. TaxID=1925024 RepID=UPI003221B795